MVEVGAIPNGTLPAQLVRIVPSRIPGWWPAPETAADTAFDAAAVGAATRQRCVRLRPVAPEGARLLALQAHVLERHAHVLNTT